MKPDDMGVGDTAGNKDLSHNQRHIDRSRGDDGLAMIDYKHVSDRRLRTWTSRGKRSLFLVAHPE